jgi:hypothetical protein
MSSEFAKITADHAATADDWTAFRPWRREKRDTTISLERGTEMSRLVFAKRCMRVTCPFQQPSRDLGEWHRCVPSAAVLALMLEVRQTTS